MGVKVDYRQGLQFLHLLHATSSSPGLASAAGTALCLQTCSYKQRLIPTAHTLLFSALAKIGGDQRFLLTRLFPRSTVLHLTALAIEFGFPRKVTTVPKFPAWELAYHITPQLSRHPSWLLQVTVSPELSAQSTQKTEESEGNFPIANFSRHQPLESLFALPRAALPTRLSRLRFQLSRAVFSPATGVVLRSTEQQGSNL